MNAEETEIKTRVIGVDRKMLNLVFDSERRVSGRYGGTPGVTLTSPGMSPDVTGSSDTGTGD